MADASLHPEAENLYSLWLGASAFPSAGDLREPEGVRHTVVHRADEALGFLHDNAVVSHTGVLFAAWYNCPKGEIVESACIRARRSHDSGLTWSPVEVIAADSDQRGVFYVPVAFLSHDGVLYAFVATMVGHDLVTGCEVFVLDPVRGQWVNRGRIAEGFLPNAAPLRMADGNYIMAGRATPKPGTHPHLPAVAVSRGDRFTEPWDVVFMTKQAMPPHPETTAWVDGIDITALVRQPHGAVVFTSADAGRSWTQPRHANLPVADSKLYAGTLSTGERYLVWNLPRTDPDRSDRDHLVIATSRPGDTRLCHAWTLQRGFSSRLGVGPEWSYPAAYEHDGTLCVIYTSQKAHSAMTSIPIAALTQS